MHEKKSDFDLSIFFLYDIILIWDGRYDPADWFQRYTEKMVLLTATKLGTTNNFLLL